MLKGLRKTRTETSKDLIGWRDRRRTPRMPLLAAISEDRSDDTLDHLRRTLPQNPWTSRRLRRPCAVTRRSGTSVRARLPARCNEQVKNANFRSAWIASFQDLISRVNYDRKHAQGRKHNATVICVAPRRCDVMFTMLEIGTLSQDKAPPVSCPKAQDAPPHNAAMSFPVICEWRNHPSALGALQYSTQSKGNGRLVPGPAWGDPRPFAAAFLAESEPQIGDVSRRADFVPASTHVPCMSTLLRRTPSSPKRSSRMGRESHVEDIPAFPCSGTGAVSTRRDVQNDSPSFAIATTSGRCSQ